MHIVFYTEGLPFDGESPERGSLGGSETAVVCMARALAALGHEVEVYCRCLRPGEYGGVRYHDLAEFGRAAACDVLVVSRFAGALAGPVEGRLNMLWLHDLLTEESAALVRGVLWKAEGIFVLSRFHRTHCARLLPEAGEALWVTRNGMDLEAVAQGRAAAGERDRFRLLYVSRPERGLVRLLEMWPRLRAAEPRLTLRVAWYENPLADREQASVAHRIAERLAALAGVTRLGPLAKVDLYREMHEAGALAYPTDFPETSCIAAMEAAACGLPVVTSRYAALKETVREGESGLLVSGHPEGERYREQFAETLLGLLRDEARWQAMSESARGWGERLGWDRVAQDWNERFERALKDRPAAPLSHRAGGRQSLSVCMIVKDAGTTLRRCLESLRPIADEVLVYDTGSVDDTVQVAQRYADRVERIPWPGDFAEARNRSIERARGDWVLWIDADEMLVGAEHLGKYLRQNSYLGYVIRQHHTAVDAEFPPDCPVRLFRNRRGIRFFGAIHEHPETGLNRGVEPAVTLSDVHIVHDGYLTERIRRERFRRNLPLLVRDRERYPGRRIGLVFLARDYLHLARYEIERTGGMSARAAGWLGKVVAIHRSHFMAEEATFHEHSRPLYEEALRLLGEGFEADCFLAVGRELARSGAKPERRRFLDEGELRGYLEGRMARAFRRLAAPAELAFEEDDDGLCDGGGLPADQRGAGGSGDPGGVEQRAVPGDLPGADDSRG